MSVKFQENQIKSNDKPNQITIKNICAVLGNVEEHNYEDLIKISDNPTTSKELLSMLLKKVLEQKSNEVPELMVKLFKILINRGVVLDTRYDYSGDTPLMIVCSRDWQSIAELILLENPEEARLVNKSNKNCLHFTINSSFSNSINTDLIHLLLKNGANPNTKESYKGDSSLSLAVKKGNMELAALLLQFEADPNLEIGENDDTILMISCQTFNKQMISILLLNNANPEKKNKLNQNTFDILDKLQEDTNNDKQLINEIRENIYTLYTQSKNGRKSKSGNDTSIEKQSKAYFNEKNNNKKSKNNKDNKKSNSFNNNNNNIASQTQQYPLTNPPQNLNLSVLQQNLTGLNNNNINTNYNNPEGNNYNTYNTNQNNLSYNQNNAHNMNNSVTNTSQINEYMNQSINNTSNNNFNNQINNYNNMSNRNQGYSNINNGLINTQLFAQNSEELKKHNNFNNLNNNNINYMPNIQNYQQNQANAMYNLVQQNIINNQINNNAIVGAQNSNSSFNNNSYINNNTVNTTNNQLNPKPKNSVSGSLNTNNPSPNPSNHNNHNKYYKNTNKSTPLLSTNSKTFNPVTKRNSISEKHLNNVHTKSSKDNKSLISQLRDEFSFEKVHQHLNTMSKIIKDYNNNECFLKSKNHDKADKEDLDTIEFPESFLRLQKPNPDKPEKIVVKINLDNNFNQEFNCLKSDVRMLRNQTYVQHQTIFELHRNSINLTEVLEYYRNELIQFSETKRIVEEKMSVKLIEINDKDTKLLVASQKIAELEKFQAILLERNNIQEKKINELNDELKLYKASFNQNDLSICTNSTINNFTSNIDFSSITQIQSPKTIDNIKNSCMSHKINNYFDRKFLSDFMDCNSVAHMLTKDIMDFNEYNRAQIRKNRKTVDDIIHNFQSLVQGYFPDLAISVFGSYATNLCLPWSDIDLVIYSKSGSALNNSILRNIKQIVENNLTWIQSILYVENTSIPVLKLVTAEEFHIDISIQDGKHFGLQCVQLVKMYLDDYPDLLEPIVICLKNILKWACLNDPYKGGLSSYGLINLVVHYIQLLEESDKINLIKDKNNLGRFLLEILYYYGAKFDHNRIIIENYPPKSKTTDRKKYFTNYSSPHELHIVDPLNPNNNVGKSSYNFNNIRMTFLISYIVARLPCNCSCHTDDRFSSLNFDHCILNVMFNSVRRCNFGELIPAPNFKSKK